MTQLISRSIFVGWLALATLKSATAGVAEAPTATTANLKYEEPTYLSAAIYSSGDSPGKLLFRFKRTAKRSGSTLEVQRDFTYPDGRIADRERVVYQADTLVSYELEESQIGAAGKAIIQHPAGNAVEGTLNFEYAKEQASRSKSRTEFLADNTLVGDMIGPFLVEHWAALARGDKVKCRYIVVPRRETVGFTFFRDSESVSQGRHVLLVKMQPTSSIIAALVDPCIFTIEIASPHRVLQYAGRTTPKIQVAGKWKDLDAVTVFDWDSAR